MNPDFFRLHYIQYHSPYRRWKFECLSHIIGRRGNIVRTAIRQMGLIQNDLSNLYQPLWGNSSMAVSEIFWSLKMKLHRRNAAEELHWSSVGRYFKGAYMGAPNGWLEKRVDSQATIIFAFGRNLGRRSTSYAEVKINC